MAKNRNSGIELLRIIAMFMVIGVHILLYGNYYNAALNVGGGIALGAEYLKILFRPGVNIFVMLTGYFMVRRRFDLGKSYKRVMKIYLGIFFYSVVLSLITLAMGPDFYYVWGYKTPVYGIVLKMIFPVMSQQWYFISDYIVLCLFAPFINIALQKITKSQYQVLMVVSSVVMSLWFILSNIKVLEPAISTYGFTGIAEGKNPFSFAFIYMIGGYIRLHTKDADRPKLRYLILFVGCMIINVLLVNQLQGIFVTREAVYKYSNPFVILMAVSLLMFFKDIKFYNKGINKIASTTLGIYAIHEFTYIRPVLWGLFNFNKMDCSKGLLNFVYIVGIMAFIFTVGMVVDLLRQKLFDIIGKLLKKGDVSQQN